MRCAFDADVLIFAARPGHPQGPALHRLLNADAVERFGSVLLLPEVMIKPTRDELRAERTRAVDVLGQLHLIDVNTDIAEMAVEVGAAYGLKAVDAVHLATAAWAGANIFVTNNRRDFKADLITEVDVCYPDELP